MKGVSQKTIPDVSIVAKNFEGYDYFDCYEITSPHNQTVDTALNKIFQPPNWIKRLLKFRDYLAVKINLRATTSNTNSKEHCEIGSKAIVFKVIDRNINEIVMEEKDSHLDFRTSVLIKPEGDIQNIYFISLVKYNNFMGKLYFFAIKPFHKMIVKRLLQNCLKK